MFSASSSSSLESLSYPLSAGIQSTPSSTLFSSQLRSTSSSSYTKQLSSENPNRLSLTSSLSSSKFEPISGSSSSLRATPTSQITSLTSKMLDHLFVCKIILWFIFFYFRQSRGVTLYQCLADNDSELSFNVNEIVTQGKIDFIQNLFNFILFFSFSSTIKRTWMGK